MSVDLFWTPYRGPGRIGIATRPRGGDWLKEDIQYLHNAGTDVLVSMLTPEESRELELEMEQKLCKNEGMDYLNIPIQDRDVPSTIKNISPVAYQLSTYLEDGSNVIVHCRQGIGRSAMMIALVLVACGIQVDPAFRMIEKARGRPVPDTEEQKTWVEQYAAGLQLMNGLKVADASGCGR